MPSAWRLGPGCWRLCVAVCSSISCRVGAIRDVAADRAQVTFPARMVAVYNVSPLLESKPELRCSWPSGHKQPVLTIAVRRGGAGARVYACPHYHASMRRCRLVLATRTGQPARRSHTS